MSSDENPDFLLCIRDYTIPSYMWIVSLAIINKYKDPSTNQADQPVFHGSCHQVGFVSTAHMGLSSLVGNPKLNRYLPLNKYPRDIRYIWG